MTKRAPRAQPGSRTAYVILRRVDSAGYQPVEDREAASATAAIRGHIADSGANGGDLFVAVPRQSWRELEYQVKVTTSAALVPHEADDAQDAQDALPL